jgi:hypothetical protein
MLSAILFLVLAAGVPSFQRIVRKKFDVRPPGVAVKVRGGRRLLGWRTGSKNKEKNRGKHATHEIRS